METAPRTPATPRYRRGQESRERILAAALDAFGHKGLEAASTRDIAGAAQVNLPAIQYYFGNKEGLYLACAEHIVSTYAGATLAAGEAAKRTLTEDPSPETCRAELAKLLTTLARFLVSADDTRSWSLFVQRELAKPGPAFDILFERLWSPGVELVAYLLAGVRGKSRPGAETRLEAIQMISGITTFASGRAAIERFLPPGTAIADQLCQLVERQIADIKG
ncbi:CerR family C-terminal domain-containing protein [Sandaracinobacteroides hominis]|uniref:CerR family C-terminal domain-containing protein n=1 Tax=Sandaracinobacteroides hominis TaxID=2780086 RepID=UPI0018F44E48|nr:CerR family C-terminal domain-containing protein [Sandaracinobacteroides hominis]